MANIVTHHSLFSYTHFPYTDLHMSSHSLKSQSSKYFLRPKGSFLGDHNFHAIWLIFDTWMSSFGLFRPFFLGSMVDGCRLFSNFSSVLVLLRKTINFVALRVLCFLGFVILLMTVTGYLKKRWKRINKQYFLQKRSFSRYSL